MDVRGVLRFLDDARGDEDKEIGLVADFRLVLEQPAQQRDVAQQGDLVDAVAGGVLNQPADHDRVAAPHGDGRLGRPFQRGRGQNFLARADVLGLRVQLRDGLVEFQADEAFFVDLGRDLQRDPHVLVLVAAVIDGRRGRRVLAGDIGDILAHGHLGLFVVQRQKLRGGQDADIRVGLVSVDKGGKVRKGDIRPADRCHPNGLPDHAQREAGGE